MSDTGEADKFGEKPRHTGKVRVDQWTLERERDLLANLRRHAEERATAERQQGGSPKIFKKILCPLDFEPNSFKALDLAGRLASQNDAGLYLLHVCSAIFVPLGGPVTDQVISEQSAKRVMQEIVDQQLKAGRCRIFVETGDVADKVLSRQVTSDVDLIVMGTHGRQAVSHFFLGSVAERVVRRAPCRVLTIRAD